MKIGIDISQLVYSGTGVARYTEGLVKAILKYNCQHEWRFFFSSLRRKLPVKIAGLINKQGYYLKQYPFPPTFLSWLWNKNHLVDMRILLGGLDWFISSDWLEPPYKGVKKATIIHDLVFLRYPETTAWQILKTQSARLVHVSNESDLIFADSKATKNDIDELLNLKKAKVEVLYPGVEVEYPDKATVKKILNRLNLKHKQFILTVGKLEPRKNLERLVEAYRRLESDYPLVIAGPKGWGSLNLAGRNVKVTNYLSDRQLFALYQSCLIFVYPSLYEGFGYPLLEAANFKTPLACSNRSSLQELGKDISLQFDPENVGDMTAKMERLLKDPQLREELGEKAVKKAKQFTWQRTYLQLISSLAEK